MIHFLVTCVKTKHNESYSLTEKEFGFETTLILNPIFKFINATVTNIHINYGFNLSTKAKPHPTGYTSLPPRGCLECTNVSRKINTYKNLIIYVNLDVDVSLFGM